MSNQNVYISETDKMSTISPKKKNQKGRVSNRFFNINLIIIVL